MKNFTLRKRLWFVLFCALIASGSGMQAVVWNGPVTASVTDDNIDIAGDVSINARVYVTAATTDVNVTLSNADAIISSSNQLHFYASNNHSIIVDLSANPYDLTFRGTAGLNFLITFSADGSPASELLFNLGDGQTVTFDSNPLGGGAAQFFIIMNGNNNSPTVVIASPVAPMTNFSFFKVTDGALFSFAATNDTDQGAVSFRSNDPDSSTGKLILDIGNNAAFTIDGNFISNIINPSLADIDLTNNLGLPAFTVLGGGGFSPLMIINSNMVYPRLKIDPFCEGDNNPYTGFRPGFVLGANGVLTVDTSVYLDYVVTVSNITPSVIISPTIVEEGTENIRVITSLYKDRNAAALIVDGDPTHTTTAQIIMTDPAAIYFRSGVDEDGISTFTVTDNGSTVISFTIAPNEDFDNEGSYVLDVEGPLNVFGDADNSVFNILSLYVTPTGGSVLIEGNETEFPLRTFQTDENGDYLQYARAAFMINNRLNFVNAQLQHTDEIHTQQTTYPLETSLAPLPERYAPTYVGGESRNFARLGCSQAALENTMAFYGQAGTVYGSDANAGFLIHSSGALTGVDTLFTSNNLEGEPSSSSRGVIFYYNGRCIDNGGGREVVFGVNNGSVASDFATIINRDAHFNVMPDNLTAPFAQTVGLYVLPNNEKVTEGLTYDITGQFGVQTLYLGNNSNISVGVNSDVVLPEENISTLNIAGDYFAFWSEGGTLKLPEMSMTTGEGGIFVDQNGIFQLQPMPLNGQLPRTSFGAMVTKSRNALVNLPSNSVFFAPRMGLADWKLTLTVPAERVIVPAGAQFGDYTFDWANLRKDYCGTDTNVPYELPYTPVAGQSPAVSTANLVGLPLVYGSVDQLQIINSRLGDQAQVIISGSANGIVRETVFLNVDEPGTCPTAFIVVQDDAILGLGTASRNVDSLDASVVLGINGVTLVANGDATVRLNCNALINNVCHILTGTLFGATGLQELLIDSAVPTELRVKSNGILDLTQFTNVNQQLTIGGQVHLVLEPGAQVLLGGGSLFFTDQASLECTPYVNAGQPAGTTTASTDNFRVKFIGSGRVTFKEGSQMLVPRGAIVGIETAVDSLGIDTTAQSWLLTDDAQLLIGSSQLYGGAFQVGNTAAQDDALITFTLTLDGLGALASIDTQGFLGFNVGIVNKPEAAPNTWLVGNLFNVNGIELVFTQGTFRHQQIFTGDDRNASLLAFGPSVNAPNVPNIYTISNLTAKNLTILGGGNMVEIFGVVGSPAAIAPTVTTVSGLINPNLSVGILCSKPTLQDGSKNGQAGSLVPASPMTVASLFNYLSVNPFASQSSPKAQVVQSLLNQINFGYVNGTTIARGLANYVFGLNHTKVPPTNVLALGAANMDLNGQAVTLNDITEL